MRQNYLFDAPARITNDESFEEILHDMCSKHLNDQSMFIMDIGDILNKVKTWRLMMPRVKIFYAVKCNDHPSVLNMLNALGTGFDCASKSEFTRIRKMGVPSSRIIYAHPSKPISHIQSAMTNGVDLMTFDSKSELEKVKRVFPDARLVLRIRCDAEVAQCPLGMKFGLPPEHAHILLEAARDLDLNVVGVSFHVGSGCQEPAVFHRAIGLCREVFDVAKNYGFNFKLLDIGGGFPGTRGNTLDELANYVNKGLLEYFPDESEVEVIAEPGRYVVASAFTLITKVLSTQSSNIAEETGPFGYYLNDGVYGSFNCVVFDHQEVEPHVMKECLKDQPVYPSILWGPTCDSFDQIMKDVNLPKLEPGDALYWRDMGAYTLSAASTFNGFPVPEVHLIVPSHVWPFIDQIVEESENLRLASLANEPLTIEPDLPPMKYKPFFPNQLVAEIHYPSAFDTILTLKDTE